MRRIVLALLTTVTAVVLLFGYRTSSPPAAVATGAAGSATTPASGTSGTSGSSGTSSSSGSSGGSTTWTGSAVSTRWGPVQVQITVAGGKITAADALVVPSGNRRDVEINGYAVPILDSEVLEAQDADIDAVSGATVTSDGYVASLQSALDRAGW